MRSVCKGLLLAGRSEPRFGGGRIVQPMQFIICGRATPLGAAGTATEIAVAAARTHLRAAIGLEPEAGAITAHIGSTSASPGQLFAAGSSMPRANMPRA